MIATFVPVEENYGQVNKSWLEWRGWTRTMIRRFLDPPDRTLLRYYPRRDRPECFYQMARVIAAEDSEEFCRWKKRLERRRHRAAYRDAVGRRARPRPRRSRSAPGFEAGFPPEVEPAYYALSKRDRMIIRRLLLHGAKQAPLAKELGISQQTISFVKRRFLKTVN